ncbi:TOM1-like protein 2 [Morus notabilis]|uniref:TOM1-like protein 2 n=1 Tax=Morus notabilis TaxID=981085 RepID=W9QMF3_9ROSA|nr:TOM1-like protein 6 [Morus notabilis]EXB42395.1 TOM1-like protein 2 [Morus notabilis]
MLPMASSSSSSSSATVAVEKATSDLLISPDWTMNIDICDSVNSHHWQAKDVVKALKRRLQHKNSKVQLLSLTLLETMVKNCGDYVHFQIAERNILGEMIKIVKKKADMQVREKILVLLDSWQEAFGGPGGKYPQYYWAYEELRRSGVEFPKRSLDASPIFTPPASHPTLGRPQPGYGMPSNASRRLDETMATEIETLSLSSIEAMRNVLELLGDMLQAVNPSDCTAIKDEVIVELVNRCRANQKKLMQMLTSTGDEELLAKGLELNDSLQSLLAKHDAIAAGSPLPAQLTNSSPQRTKTSTSSIKQAEVKDSSPRDFSPRPNVSPSAPVTTLIRSQIYEEEEEEDEFAQLARRHSKALSTAPQSTSNGTTEGLAIVSVSSSTSTPAASTSAMSNALALPDPPAPVKTKEQDIIDLLSITLSTTEASPLTPHTPPSNQNMHQVPVSASTQAFPHASQTYSGIQGQVPYNSYVAPWAQPHQQTQPEAPPQPLPRAQAHPHVQPQPSSHVQPRPSSHVQPQASSLVQPQPSTYSSGYPPPPWAATPGYYSSQSHFPTNNAFATHTKTSYRPVQTNTTVSYTPAQSGQPLQHYNSFPARENGLAINGESRVAAPNARNPAPPAAQKPFIPSYRLFEDLNVFGSASGNASSGLAGTSGQSMVGGRK